MAKAKAAGATRKATAKAAPAAKAAPKKPSTRKADVFAAADAKPAKQEKKSAGKKPKTVLRIPDVAGDAVHQAVPGFRKAKLQKNSGESQLEANKNELTPIAVKLFSEAWIKQQGLPEKPMALVNADDEKLTYVFCDKSTLAVVSEETYDELVDKFPEAAKLIAEETIYSIDPAVFEQEGVREALAEAIASADLTDEQRQSLIVSKTVRRTRESFVPHLLELCGEDPDKLVDLFTILKGQLSQYVNV